MPDRLVENETASYLDALPTWLLGRANARSHQLLSSALERHGATGYHVRVLIALHEFGPQDQTALGHHCALDRADVARTLDELDARRVTRRRPDPTDRRRKSVTLTAAGRRWLTTLKEVLDDVQDQVLAPLTEHERRQLSDLLRLLQP